MKLVYGLAILTKMEEQKKPVKLKPLKKITYGLAFDKLFKGLMDFFMGMFYLAMCLSESLMKLFDNIFAKGGAYDKSFKTYDKQYGKPYKNQYQKSYDKQYVNPYNPYESQYNKGRLR